MNCIEINYAEPCLSTALTFRFPNTDLKRCGRPIMPSGIISITIRNGGQEEVDLSKYRDKEIELTLTTHTPPGKNQYCVAVWSRPHLVEKNK